MNQSERIGELLFRFTRNELSASEKVELEAWRNADPEHEQAFIEETDPEQIQKNHIGMQQNKEAVWKKLQERFPDTFVQEAPPARILGMNVRRFAAAAGILLMFGLYFLFRGPSKQNDTDAILFDPDGVKTVLDDFHRGMMDGSQFFSIRHNEKGVLEFTPPKDSTTPLNRNYTLVTRSSKLILDLPPGIRISLNDSSSVTYPKNTERDTIRVAVNGETYVEINRPESKPMLVTAKSESDSTFAQIIASRARLNIQAYPDSGMVQITLIDGLASIVLSDKTYPIQPGQQVVFRNRQFNITNLANPDTVIQWAK